MAAVHGSSITASITTITILDSYTFTWKRLIITLQQNMEHASCSQIIVASLLMLKVQMHFAFAVDNFHTVDCAVIHNLPSVIIQFTRGRVPVRVITLPRPLCRPPDAARPRILGSPPRSEGQTLPLVTTPALTTTSPTLASAGLRYTSTVKLGQREFSNKILDII